MHLNNNHILDKTLMNFVSHFVCYCFITMAIPFVLEVFSIMRLGHICFFSLVSVLVLIFSKRLFLCEWVQGYFPISFVRRDFSQAFLSCKAVAFYSNWWSDVNPSEEVFPDRVPCQQGLWITDFENCYFHL